MLAQATEFMICVGWRVGNQPPALKFRPNSYLYNIGMADEQLQLRFKIVTYYELAAALPV